jgi:4-amino-4-deoxy-L-arabinose transferase-like glycosyltransferase
MFWLTFLPGSMLAPVAAPAIWRDRGEPGTKFLLAWIVPSWIVFEIVATKLPHYVMPLYPAIAILIAGVIDGHVLSKNRWLVRAPVWWFILTLAGAVGVVTLHFVIGQRLGVLSWPFAAAAIIFAMFAWWLFKVDGAELSLLRAATASILLSAALFGATLPSIPRLFPSVDLSKFVHSAPCRDPVVATAGYHEPSLVFLTGTDLIHATAAQAAEILNGGPCRFAFIEGRQERSFVQRADAIGLRYYLGRRVDGYNLTDGRGISVAIFHTELPR